MTAGVLDVVLLLVVLSYAFAGWRTGFVAASLSIIGFVGGALLGVALLPRAIVALGAQDQPALTRAVLLVGGIVALAALGQALFHVLARPLGSLVRGHHVGRGLDAVLGAVVGALVTLTVVWAVALASRPLLPQSWSRTAAQSQVLGAVDAVMPRGATEALTRLRGPDGIGGFPQVFGGLRAEPIVPVTPPDPNVKMTPGLAAAKASVVRVVAEARSCNRLEKGSGWVAAPGRVVTNAHVVAGASAVTVSSAGTGRLRDATVVFIDPGLDLAVLSVPGLPVPALRTSPDLGPQASAVVAGFPLGGGYTLGSARVRRLLDASGSDIYGHGRVERRVYSLYATVRPGNSGGPLLTPDGRVAGTVFARSLDDVRTGYALTTAQTQAAVATGLRASAPVGTGACTAG